jgi:hypothetical protein
MFGTPTYYHECSLLLLYGHVPGIAGTAKELAATKTGDMDLK